ncbi:unnamed protein product [Closterium sp. NIES-54]
MLPTPPTPLPPPQSQGTTRQCLRSTRASALSAYPALPPPPLHTTCYPTPPHPTVSTHDKAVFAFNEGQRPCNGFEEALQRYRAITPLVQLSGCAVLCCAMPCRAVPCPANIGAAFSVPRLTASALRIPHPPRFPPQPILSPSPHPLPHPSPMCALAGPTSFAPAIEAAVRAVEESGGQYHVLLIIADGQVQCGASG